MADSVADLAAKGAALEPADRSRLIDLLLASLQEAPLDDVQAAWDQEIGHRLDAYERGEITPVDGDAVLAEAKRLAR